MENNKILVAVVSLAVIIITLATVLVPVVGQAQITMGDPITLDQSGSKTNTPLGKITDEVVVITVVEGGYSINGVVAPLPTGVTHAPIVYADTGAVRCRSATGGVSFENYSNPDALVTLAVGTTITVGNGKIAIDTSAPVELAYNVCYSVGASADLAVIIDMGYRYETRSLITSVKDIIIYGAYTTGENDTPFSFVNGQVTVAEDFTSSYSADLVLKDGTTDIYQIESFVIDVGGETFTPYYALVPLHVSGHATSGAAYDIIGLLPILVIVSLITAAIAVFIRARY